MSRIIRSNTVYVDKENVFNPEVNNQFIPNISLDNNVVHESREAETAFVKQSILQQASKEADSIISSAKIKAIQIIGDAEREAEKKAEAIYKKAEKEGYDKGYSEGENKSQQLINKANKELNDAVSERKKMIESLEPEMVDLVSNILENIFGKVKVVDKNIILNLIRQGMGESTITGEINIRVSQADFETVINAKEEISAMAVGASELEIIKDPSLKELDCIIETQFGSIDCSLDKQFQGLKENLYYILDNR